MKITTKGRYALRAVINLTLNSREQPLSIKAITENENLSPIFLEQIFTKLKQAKIINSIRGAKGGFLLAKPPDKITVREIFEAVDENIDITPCAGNDSKETDCGRQEECVCSGFWKDTSEKMLDYFSSITVDDIIKRYSKGCIEFKTSVTSAL